MVIDFDGDGITDLTLSANTDFTATFDSPGLDRVPGWGVAPGNISFEDYDFPDIEFAFPRTRDDVWFWGDSNAEEVVGSLDHAYRGDTWLIFENTTFKVDPLPGSPSGDMVVQGSVEYTALSLSTTKQLFQRWLSVGDFAADEEFQSLIDPNVAVHLPETGQPGVGRAVVRMTDLETPKTPVTDPDSPVDFFFLLEDSAIIRDYFAPYAADLNGDFLGTGSQAQGACNILLGATSINFACSHNVQDATAFTLNDTSGSESTEVFRMPLIGEPTFSGSISEETFDQLLDPLREQLDALINSPLFPDGEIGARVYRLPLGDPKF